jgi:AraC-like DNA-binding protein
MNMFHKINTLLVFLLSISSLAGASDIKSKIANAQGREKLGLILNFFKDAGQALDDEKAAQLLDHYAKEALALSKQLHERRSEGLAYKYAANIEYVRQQYEPALESYFQCRRIFRELGDQKNEAAVNKEIANLFSKFFFVLSDYDRTSDYYKRSLARIRLNKSQADTAKCLTNIADAYHGKGDFLNAIPQYREALQLNERGRDLSDSDRILCNLSDVYLKMGNLSESTKYYRQALDLNKIKREKQEIARIDSKKGYLCMEQNDFSQALGYFQQALEIHEKYSGTARTVLQLRNLGRLHAQFKQDGKAQEYFQQELALNQLISDQNEIIQTILAQAASLQKQNELPQAEALLLFCENQAKQKHLQGKISETYRELSSLYSRRHDPVKVLYYQTLQNKAQYGLPSVTILAGIHNLMAIHENDKEINELKTQKRRQTIVGILAIGLLLTLIGILVGKQRSIRHWVRDHLFSKDRQLQKKQAQLLGLRQKLSELQEKPAPSKNGAPPARKGRDLEYLRLVLRLMQQDKIFLDSELTLKKTAARIGANTSYLSKALNEYLGMGFSDFINHFRIEEAKRIMAADDQNEWDIVDICYEVGFNSMSSFYRIFKLHTGTSPAEFLRSC